MTSTTASEARKMFGKQKRRNKFNAKRVTVDGIEFDSTKEANRWMHLRALEKAGQISHLERQPKIYLYSGNQPVQGESGRHLFYRPDYRYFEGETSARVIEDCKGFKTKEYLLKKAFVQAMYPGLRIRET